MTVPAPVAGRRRPTGCRGKRERPHESRRRGEIAGEAEHARALADRRQRGALDGERGHVRRRLVDVVAQVDQVPVEWWAVGSHADRILVHLSRSAEPFDDGGGAAAIVQN
jgi:hypothetical protein